MTSDHLFPLLSHERDSELLVQVGSLLARGDVPDVIIEAIRLGRVTALSKPDGGVRGIVVGDIIRRLVARTMAKQVSKKVETATAPFLYALSTKAGCECVAHMLQSLTDVDPEATVISIDGVGAYDLISRNAMMEGLLNMVRSSPLCGASTVPHQRICGRTRWASHSTFQGEGGEQGLPHALALRVGPAWRIGGGRRAFQRR